MPAGFQAASDASSSNAAVSASGVPPVAGTSAISRFV